jgi:elongation factor G
VEDLLNIHHADSIRNIALVGHESTGKTLLNEALLKMGGEINRMGSIEGQNTVSDFTRYEQERQKSLSCTLSQLEWRGVKLNLLDTPGFSDFYGETITGLHVADIACVLVSPFNGPEVITEAVMETVESRSMPCIFVFNGLDKEHVRFEEELQALSDAFSGVVQLQYPLETGERFHRVVDILKRKVLVFDGEGAVREEDLGAEADKVEERLAALTETVAESDDELMEAYLETMELSPEQFERGLAVGIVKGTIRPVVCTSAKKLVGVSRLLDLLVDHYPGPDRAPAASGIKGDEACEIACNGKAPTQAFVFKTVNEQHVGELSFFRVYAGSIRPGDELYHAVSANPEKIGSLFSVLGKQRKDLAEVHAGDMACTVKLRATHTNDSLCTKGQLVRRTPIAFPEPVMRTAIEPEKADDDEKMSTGLLTIRHEDPSFTVSQDGELRQTILAGQGEQQFKVLLDKLEDRYHVKVKLIKPRVPYRETITGNADVKYRHKKQTGGAGQFAEVWIRMKAGERGSGFVFKSEVVGGAVTVPFQQATEKGMRALLSEGVVAGCRVEDVEVTIYDGKMHAVDSKEIAFQIAGREAFKQGFTECKPILLEPIWEVEVKTPDEFMGDVMGDLSSRRGKILGMDSAGKYQVIKALVPLAELYQYSTTLRSMTSGRATHRRRFDHYEKCPPDVQQKVIEEYQAERDKD